MELLLPVGHSLGATTDPASGAPVYRVRVGPDVVRLGEQRFTLWALVHGLGERTAVVDTAGFPDAAAALDALIADGLIAAVEPGTPSAAAFARAHRLAPLMLGLGNLPDDPETYEVGLPGRPVARLGAVQFRLYQWGHLETDLWAACLATAALAGTDPAALLDTTLDTVHTLLSPNAAYLDTAA